MVFSIGWHFLRDRSAAEELAQDAFLQLHRNLGSIESPAHLTNWLRRVMTQRCIDYSRRARLRPRVGLDDAPEPSVAAAPPDPYLTSILDRQIARLPERSRMIVVLRFQEEMEPAEIAETMGIPVGTVKSNLHRALALMRGRMEKARV
jgi:RNA polymerase sigma-70 factor, ECF subfamily